MNFKNFHCVRNKPHFSPGAPQFWSALNLNQEGGWFAFIWSHLDKLLASTEERKKGKKSTECVCACKNMITLCCDNIFLCVFTSATSTHARTHAQESSAFTVFFLIWQDSVGEIRAFDSVMERSDKASYLGQLYEQTDYIL